MINWLKYVLPLQDLQIIFPVSLGIKHKFKYEELNKHRNMQSSP